MHVLRDTTFIADLKYFKVESKELAQAQQVDASDRMVTFITKVISPWAEDYFLFM